MRPRIRQATALDLEAMAAMKDAAWRESYPGLVPDAVLAGLEERRPRVVSRWLEAMSDGASFWIATDDGDIVGLAHASWARDADAPVALELDMFYLLERAKGTGLGRALMHTALGDADASLWVLDGNARAMSFYAREGFVPDGATREVPGLPGLRESRIVRRAAPVEG